MRTPARYWNNMVALQLATSGATVSARVIVALENPISDYTPFMRRRSVQLLTVAPPDHNAVSQATGIGKRSQNSINVSLIRS